MICVSQPQQVHGNASNDDGGNKAAKKLVVILKLHEYQTNAVNLGISLSDSVSIENTERVSK